MNNTRRITDNRKGVFENVGKLLNVIKTLLQIIEKSYENRRNPFEIYGLPPQPPTCPALAASMMKFSNVLQMQLLLLPL